MTLDDGIIVAFVCWRVSIAKEKERKGKEEQVMYSDTRDEHASLF